MREEKGISLISLVVYIIGMIVVMAVVGTLLSFYNNNVVSMNDTADVNMELNKFIAKMIEETKEAGNQVMDISDKTVRFKSGNTYTYGDNRIYENTIVVSNYVKDFSVNLETDGNKQMLRVYIVLEKGNVEKIENLRYVMTANQPSVAYQPTYTGTIYKEPFITTWSVEAGDTITLPIYEMEETNEERGETETYFNYNFKVDYGEGTIAEVTSFDDEDRIHTYTNAGEYDIKVMGLCESWSFKAIADSALKVKGLKQWGVVGAKHIDFWSCENLTGNIPEPNKHSFANVESFRLLFYNCTNLKTQIPENLFENATNVVTMANAFNMAGITGYIPNDLLKNCTKVENVRYMFAGCPNLDGVIPEKLFVNCISLKNANGVFSAIPNIKEIPEKIFYNNTNIVSVESIFAQCTEIKEIPENLLVNCSKVTNISGMFLGCRGLEIVPENLFVNNTEITNMRSTFHTCTNLNNIQLKITAKSAGVYDMFYNVTGSVKVLVPNNSYTKTQLETYYGTSTNITIEGYDI